MNDLTYLYVEDDPMSRDALSLILTRVMKLENVHVFENSHNFVERVDSLPNVPDIFLLDIHMEPLTGFEMLEILRNNPTYQNATIIALTASVMNEEVELLKNSGFDGVIGKPITVASFPELLKRIVAGEKVWHVTDM